MMKTVVCVALFFLISQGEALKCNFCFSQSSSLCSPTSVQICSAADTACAAVINTLAPFSERMCMNMAICQNWIKTPGAYAVCCSTDLCN